MIYFSRGWGVGSRNFEGFKPLMSLNEHVLTHGVEECCTMVPSLLHGT